MKISIPEGNVHPPCDYPTIKTKDPKTWEFHSEKKGQPEAGFISQKEVLHCSDILSDHLLGETGGQATTPSGPHLDKAVCFCMPLAFSLNLNLTVGTLSTDLRGHWTFFLFPLWPHWIHLLPLLVPYCRLNCSMWGRWQVTLRTLVGGGEGGRRQTNGLPPEQPQLVLRRKPKWQCQSFLFLPFFSPPVCRLTSALSRARVLSPHLLSPEEAAFYRSHQRTSAQWTPEGLCAGEMPQGNERILGRYSATPPPPPPRAWLSHTAAFVYSKLTPLTCPETTAPSLGPHLLGHPLPAPQVWREVGTSLCICSTSCFLPHSSPLPWVGWGVLLCCLLTQSFSLFL